MGPEPDLGLRLRWGSTHLGPFDEGERRKVSGVRTLLQRQSLLTLLCTFRDSAHGPRPMCEDCPVFSTPGSWSHQFVEPVPESRSFLVPALTLYLPDWSPGPRRGDGPTERRPRTTEVDIPLNDVTLPDDLPSRSSLPRPKSDVPTFPHLLRVWGLGLVLIPGHWCRKTRWSLDGEVGRGVVLSEGPPPGVTVYKEVDKGWLVGHLNPLRELEGSKSSE